MKTISELLHEAYQKAAPFRGRLDELKAQNPHIDWYPFRSMDKVHLMQVVTSYFDRAQIGFFSERPKVLDVGAADGDLSFLFDSLGCDVVAVENPSSNRNRCSGIRFMREILGSRLTLIEKDIDCDFNISGQYDLILFLDILYHLRNPLGVLISLAQLGRHMVFTTRIFECAVDGKPVGSAPYAYLLAPFEAAPNDPTNYWIFTETAVERLFERSGWRVLKKAYFGYSANDSSPFDPQKDRRVVALCERVAGYETLKHRHFINRP